MTVRLLALIVCVIAGAQAAHAQSLGTFRWQLQPYCNVLTVTVTETHGVYTLDGYDDQCGAATRAPLTGTAVPNADGTIELGFNIVTSPRGAPVHVAVPISISTLSGTWRDSQGDTGTLVFAPNGGTGGNPRPASGIGAVAVDPTEVQLRVSGGCPAGQYVAQINQDGSVSCGLAMSDGIAAIVSASNGGLLASTTSRTTTLSLARTGSGAFDFSNDSGFVANTPFDRVIGVLSVSGPGKRMFWHPGKSAFRAGRVFGSQWDESRIGVDSVAFGRNTVASGPGAFVAGENSEADGAASTAIGFANLAHGDFSVALGSNARALARGSFIFADASTQSAVFAFPNQFVARVAGGATFYSNEAMTAGVRLAAGGGAWSSVSDANLKANFRDIGGDDVLGRIAAMPIREWNYLSQDAAIRHVGPTAQDFHAAFGLGEDPLRISTIDADGIALAGVKALALENQELRAELARLRIRLEQLEHTQK